MIVQLGFAKCQWGETPLIFFIAKDLYRGNFSQLEIFWKWTNKHSRCWKSVLEVWKRIHIKWLSHDNIRIWFHGYLENKLLNVKRSHWQFNIMHPYINVAQFLRMAQKVALITSKGLWKFSSTMNYNQYYGYTTHKLSMNHKQGTLQFWSQGNHQPLQPTSIF